VPRDGGRVGRVWCCCCARRSGDCARVVGLCYGGIVTRVVEGSQVRVPVYYLYRGEARVLQLGAGGCVLLPTHQSVYSK
jgi:hypothetical protein